ncbi:uncharacterized protein LOC117008720 isoform X5 [Catharus ustulatus]|uniref:uncharacterized protein LOC117008720 isoform X5 n=1 Tax=Catharus ustulatus TaxID=91951 RepID=UPI001408DFCB|nr:uncharacterized protein LOC117008720 isoform X5 [Catharus ustulatus]
MPCPRPAVPSPVVALAGWCPLSPAGAQTPQLLVEPPWTPAVLWDRVTLTCQGSGTAGATTWYKDGRRWWQEGPDSFTVTESGTYQCQRPGTGLSPPVTVSDVPVANATITPGPPALQVTPLLEVTPQGTTGHRWNTAARKQQESVPPCHHTPGSPGDLRGAGSDPWATAGMRGHLHECAVTLGALGALGTLGTPPMGTTLVVPPLLPWVPNIHG